MHLEVEVEEKKTDDKALKNLKEIDQNELLQKVIK
jgi:hypothetical protein